MNKNLTLAKRLLAVAKQLVIARPELNEAFKAWFGGSVVTDPSGEPLVVYTGTSKDADFKSFKVPQRGVWFCEDKNAASAYSMENDNQRTVFESGKYVQKNTASRVMPAYLRILNPWKPSTQDIQGWWDKFPQLQNSPDGYKKLEREMFSHALRQGHDGVQMPGGIWVVLKEPGQIKSALGNRGTWDPKKVDITAYT